MLCALSSDMPVAVSVIGNDHVSKSSFPCPTCVASLDSSLMTTVIGLFKSSVLTAVC